MDHLVEQQLRVRVVEDVQRLVRDGRVDSEEIRSRLTVDDLRLLSRAEAFRAGSSLSLSATTSLPQGRVATPFSAQKR